MRDIIYVVAIAISLFFNIWQYREAKELTKGYEEHILTLTKDIHDVHSRKWMAEQQLELVSKERDVLQNEIGILEWKEALKRWDDEWENRKTNFLVSRARNGAWIVEQYWPTEKGWTPILAYYTQIAAEDVAQTLREQSE